MGSTNIRRGFVDVDYHGEALKLHYYACGAGPPVLLLHPSPASGSSFLGLLPLLGEHVTAIALDTPGYGYSEGFAESASSLAPYVEQLDAVREALAIDQLTIYGSATGTQIAIEYAKTYPAHCSALVLDNIADFPKDEYDTLLTGYFQDLSVDSSGSHLTKTWGMILDLMRFFPWHEHTEKGRLPARALPVEIIEAQLIQFLQAGANYDKAYRVAFANERAAVLRDVECSTTIMRSSGSLIKRYADRFDAYEWPSHIRMHHCGAGIAERQAAIVSVVSKAAPECAAYSLPDQAMQSGPQFADLNGRNVFVQRLPSKNPVQLVLHDIGSSSVSLTPLLVALGKNASVFAPDLPGHGATDLPVDAKKDFVEQCGDVLKALIDDAGQASLSVVAVGQAAAIALRLKTIMPDVVTQVVLVNPLQNVESIAVAADMDGGFLMTLWHRLRNQSLYAAFDDWSENSALQGSPDLEPDHLNQQLLDHLRSRNCYEAAVADCNAYSSREQIVLHAESTSIVRTTATTAGDRSMKNLPPIANVEEHSWSANDDFPVISDA